MSGQRITPIVVASMLLLTILTACSGGDKNKGPKGKAHLVEVSVAGYETLSQSAERSGSLRALQTAKLFNQEEGRVMEVRVRQGDVVKHNDILAKLDDRLLRAQFNKANASLRQARQDLNRLKQLKKKQLISDEALGRKRTAYDVALAEQKVLKTRLDYATIRAPFNGTIAERLVESGDVAPKHTHILTLVDPSKLITDVAVSELELPYIKVGGVARVSIDALGKQVFKGSVIRIYPTVDPTTRLGRIEVALDPVPEGARAGQFCRLSLETSAQKRLMVPFSALRRDQAGEHIYVVGDDYKVQKRTVISGLRMTDKVEIRSGVQAGDRVVERGFLGLDAGKLVKVVGDEASTLARDNKPRKSKPAANTKTGNKPAIKPVPKLKPITKPQSANKGLENNA